MNIYQSSESIGPKWVDPKTRGWMACGGINSSSPNLRIMDGVSAYSALYANRVLCLGIGDVMPDV